jgi:phospholipase C
MGFIVAAQFRRRFHEGDPQIPIDPPAPAALRRLALALAGPGWSAKLPRPAVKVNTTCPLPGTIQHVIYLIKENRTFDHYFGKFPGADGATMAVDAAGQIVQLAQADDSTSPSATTCSRRSWVVHLRPVRDLG